MLKEEKSNKKNGEERSDQHEISLRVHRRLSRPRQPQRRLTGAGLGAAPDFGADITICRELSFSGVVELNNGFISYQCS